MTEELGADPRMYPLECMRPMFTEEFEDTEPERTERERSNVEGVEAREGEKEGAGRN